MADNSPRLRGNERMPQPASAGFFYLDDTELGFVWAMARRNSKDLGRSVVGKKLAKIMRANCPVIGTEWSKFLSVLLRPGQEIAPHRHSRHAMLWYPDGRMIYLRPGTEHGVSRVTVERLSVAMLIS